MTDVKKVTSKIFVRGNLTALTGLHVGGNSVGMAIGGADSVVVRNPLTNDPYVPGSSLRGKMRALLERVRGEESSNNKQEGGFSLSKKGEAFEALAGKKPDTSLGKLFGVAADKDFKEPTRLIVRDALLTEKSKEELLSAPNADMPMTEVKTEVWIDRITSVANPRHIERVPAGAEFTFELVLTLIEGDNHEHFLDLLFEGLRLVQADTLGGSGSRGYGQVKFSVTSLTQRTAEQYKSGKNETNLSDYKIPDEFNSSVAEAETVA